ncbi:hypothetical protein GGF37_006439, partial [Kickxella alabastrina]
MQQLLHHTLNLVRMKLNIDIRQVFYALTPETFEAQVREVCRDQPEVLANMNNLKASFIQIKTIQMAQLLKQQQQQQQQQQVAQNQQLGSPNGMQTASINLTSPISLQTNAGAAQQPAAQTQGQLWQGTLVWESKQGENQRHEPSCLIVATGHPGISYSALELKLPDWPEKMRVSQIVNATEQFAEYCIQSKIQMVQIGAHANATAEQIKYFDDFCTTLREKSVYALVRIGPSSATLPWNGIFFTYYRGNLVALPFMNRPITTAVIAALSRCTLNNAAAPAPAMIFNSNPAPALNGHQVGATSSGGGSVQITPQQSSLGLPMSAAANASILARSNSAGGGGPVTPVPASAVAQQQIMSPMQQFAAQPVTESPLTSNATPNQIHMVLNFLQNHLSHEQMETIRAMPPSKRDVLVTRLFDEIRAKQRL